LNYQYLENILLICDSTNIDILDYHQILDKAEKYGFYHLVIWLKEINQVKYRKIILSEKTLKYLHHEKKMNAKEMSYYFNNAYEYVLKRLKELKIYRRQRISKGEKEIENWLQSQNIKYEKEYTFKDCKDKHVLRFDFAIFNDIGELLLLIEYDGLQHFESIEYYGGEKEFENLKKRDEIKDEFCDENNIRLIRVNPYNSNISNICSP